MRDEITTMRADRAAGVAGLVFAGLFGAALPTIRADPAVAVDAWRVA